MRLNKRIGTRIPVAGAIAIGAVLALLNTTSEGIGYLARIGPSPLRFESAPAPKTRFTLPPLPTEDHPAAASNSPASEPVSVMSTNSLDGQTFPEFDVWPQGLEPGSANSSSPESDNPQTGGTESRSSMSDQPTITPQTFLEYFKPVGPYQNGTNWSGVSIPVPFNFAFPTTGASPSSRAIYRSE